MPDLVDWALGYAETMGWEVIPLHTPDAKGRCSCNVKDCRSAGKHPRTKNGVHDASKDRGQILDWWREWPNANIGLATGEASGVIVIDVDPRNGGRRTLKKLATRPPRKVIAQSGGGGRHYFADYTDEPIEHTAGKGIDIQSDRRIVVLAPSRHPSGQSYHWIRKPKRGQSFGPLPAWALQTGASRGEGDDLSVPRYYYEGERNSYLVRIGGKWRRAGLNEAELYESLSLRNRSWCVPPLEDKEVRSIARSVVRYPVVESLDAEGEELELNELGNARRLKAAHGDSIRYVKKLGWLVWTGKRWQSDSANDVRYMATSIQADIKAEADKQTDEKVAKTWKSWSNQSASERGLAAMVKIAETLPGVAAEVNAFDINPWLFNVQNGTVNLETGELQPHNRLDFITKLAPVEHDAKAKAPLFRKFLFEIFKGDEELVLYLQKLFGYCLSGSVKEQIFPIFWGTGQNGKTTLLEDVCGAVLGMDSNAYMIKLTAEALLEKRFQSHPTEIMDLRGARLAIAAESGKKRSLDEERIKELTGSDTVKARRLYANPEMFKPTHKLVLMTNNKPRASNSDAIWRRLRLIPFTFRVADADKDKDLGAKLALEAPGILNWMIKGCLEWQRNGLQEPDAVLEFTARHHDDQDILGAFFKEKVVFNPAYRCKGSDLYVAYMDWANDGGIRPLGKISFNREVLERFGESDSVKKTVSNGQQRWRGLKPLLIIK